MPVPLLAGVLISAGASLLTWIITRVIALLGIGFITVAGVKPLLDWASNHCLTGQPDKSNPCSISTPPIGSQLCNGSAS